MAKECSFYCFAREESTGRRCLNTAVQTVRNDGGMVCAEHLLPYEKIRGTDAELEFFYDGLQGRKDAEKSNGTNQTGHTG